MNKYRFFFFASACVLIATPAVADPSKPIRDAMNSPASMFDVFTHSMDSQLQRDSDKEENEISAGRVLALLIERGKMVDSNAKEEELFSAKNVARLKTTPETCFSFFRYDFQTNRFLARFYCIVPDEVGFLNTDLSFESEQSRTEFTKRITKRAYGKVFLALNRTSLRSGYETKALNEEAFLKEVTENTVVEIDWTIDTNADVDDGERDPISVVAEQLRKKGVATRRYRGTRSLGGKISVECDDTMFKK